jgi:DNA-binding transcriptional MerR regulator
LTIVKSKLARRAETGLVTTERFYTSSELLNATGCTRKALRVYQDKGLIEPRLPQGKRRYGAEAFDRLRFVMGLREFGMSIAEIGKIVNARDSGVTDLAGPLAGQLAGQIGEIVQGVTERIEGLVRLRNDLVNARETLFDCSGCTRPTEACSDCAQQGSLDSISRVLMAPGSSVASGVS